MDANNLSIEFGGELKIDNLESGFSLDLPKLALTGSGLNVIEKNNSISKEIGMFGTKLIFNDFDISFNTQNYFDLILEGKMELLGKDFDISGIHINGKSQIADTLLFKKNNGKMINNLLSVKKLETDNGNLSVSGIVKLPKIFSGK